MTRQEAKAWLSENLGIEEPTNAQVSALLNGMKDVTSVAVERAIEETKESFKDYVSREENQKLIDEIATLKDANDKTSRLSKYKESKIKDKYVDYIDSKLKDSKSFDDDLKKFIEEHKELLEAEEIVEEQVVEKDVKGGTLKFGATGNGTGTKPMSAVKEAFYKNTGLTPNN